MSFVEQSLQHGRHMSSVDSIYKKKRINLASLQS